MPFQDKIDQQDVELNGDQLHKQVIGSRINELSDTTLMQQFIKDPFNRFQQQKQLGMVLTEEKQLQLSGSMSSLMINEDQHRSVQLNNKINPQMDEHIKQQNLSEYFLQSQFPLNIQNDIQNIQQTNALLQGNYLNPFQLSQHKNQITGDINKYTLFNDQLVQSQSIDNKNLIKQSSISQTQQENKNSCVFEFNSIVIKKNPTNSQENQQISISDGNRSIKNQAEQVKLEQQDQQYYHSHINLVDQNLNSDQLSLNQNKPKQPIINCENEQQDQKAITPKKKCKNKGNKYIKELEKNLRMQQLEIENLKMKLEKSKLKMKIQKLEQQLNLEQQQTHNLTSKKSFENQNMKIIELDIEDKDASMMMDGKQIYHKFSNPIKEEYSLIKQKNEQVVGGIVKIKKEFNQNQFSHEWNDNKQCLQNKSLKRSNPYKNEELTMEMSNQIFEKTKFNVKVESDADKICQNQQNVILLNRDEAIQEVSQIKANQMSHQNQLNLNLKSINENESVNLITSLNQNETLLLEIEDTQKQQLSNQLVPNQEFQQNNDSQDCNKLFQIHQPLHLSNSMIVSESSKISHEKQNNFMSSQNTLKQDNQNLNLQNQFCQEIMCKIENLNDGLKVPLKQASQILGDKIQIGNRMNHLNQYLIEQDKYNEINIFKQNINQNTVIIVEEELDHMQDCQIIMNNQERMLTKLENQESTDQLHITDSVNSHEDSIIRIQDQQLQELKQKEDSQNQNLKDQEQQHKLQSSNLQKIEYIDQSQNEIINSNEQKQKLDFNHVAIKELVILQLMKTLSFQDFNDEEIFDETMDILTYVESEINFKQTTQEEITNSQTQLDYYNLTKETIFQNEEGQLQQILQGDRQDIQQNQQIDDLQNISENDLITESKCNKQNVNVEGEEENQSQIFIEQQELIFSDKQIIKKESSFQKASDNENVINEEQLNINSINSPERIKVLQTYDISDNSQKMQQLQKMDINKQGYSNMKVEKHCLQIDSQNSIIVLEDDDDVIINQIQNKEDKLECQSNQQPKINVKLEQKQQDIPTQKKQNIDCIIVLDDDSEISVESEKNNQEEQLNEQELNEIEMNQQNNQFNQIEIDIEQPKSEINSDSLKLTKKSKNSTKKENKSDMKKEKKIVVKERESILQIYKKNHQNEQIQIPKLSIKKEEKLSFILADVIPVQNQKQISQANKQKLKKQNKQQKDQLQQQEIIIEDQEANILNTNDGYPPIKQPKESLNQKVNKSEQIKTKKKVLEFEGNIYEEEDDGGDYINEFSHEESIYHRNFENCQINQIKKCNDKKQQVTQSIVQRDDKIQHNNYKQIQQPNKNICNLFGGEEQYDDHNDDEIFNYNKKNIKKSQPQMIEKNQNNYNMEQEEEEDYLTYNLDIEDLEYSQKNNKRRSNLKFNSDASQSNNSQRLKQTQQNSNNTQKDSFFSQSISSQNSSLQLQLTKDQKSKSLKPQTLKTQNQLSLSSKSNKSMEDNYEENNYDYYDSNVYNQLIKRDNRQTDSLESNNQNNSKLIEQIKEKHLFKQQQQQSNESKRLLQKQLQNLKDQNNFAQFEKQIQNKKINILNEKQKFLQSISIKEQPCFLAEDKIKQNEQIQVSKKMIAIDLQYMNGDRDSEDVLVKSNSKYYLLSTINETIQELVISNKKDYHILPLNNNLICLIGNYYQSCSKKIFKIIDFNTSQKIASKMFHVDFEKKIIQKSMYIPQHDVIALLFEDNIIFLDRNLQKMKTISTKLEVNMFQNHQFNEPFLGYDSHLDLIIVYTNLQFVIQIKLENNLQATFKIQKIRIRNAALSLNQAWVYKGSIYGISNCAFVKIVDYQELVQVSHEFIEPIGLSKNGIILKSNKHLYSPYLVFYDFSTSSYKDLCLFRVDSIQKNNIYIEKNFNIYKIDLEQLIKSI